MYSENIRNKLKKDGIRFWAGDNIAEYLTEDEIGNIIKEATIAFENVLDALVIDRFNDPNSQGTAKRLAKMYVNEIMEGRYHAMPNVASFPNYGETAYKGMLVVRSEIKSVCSHHHQPVTGVAYIGIIPGEKVIGLSKYARIAQWCARRGTLQEELCNDIAREIRKATESESVAVHIGARHGCMENRGVMAHSSVTQTTVLFGEFNNGDVKKEFFDNISLQMQVDGKGTY
jgi:GTP cyclohydrolase I